jgi:hypothetical protein
MDVLKIALAIVLVPVVIYGIYLVAIGFIYGFAGIGRSLEKVASMIWPERFVKPSSALLRKTSEKL